MSQNNLTVKVPSVVSIVAVAVFGNADVFSSEFDMVFSVPKRVEIGASRAIIKRVKRFASFVIEGLHLAVLKKL